MNGFGLAPLKIEGGTTQVDPSSNYAPNTKTDSWIEMLNDVLGEGENIIHCTLSDEEMAVKFDGGYGWPEGKPFTAWSETHVYFPLEYDGSESVGRVPRDPCDESMEHQ